MDNYPIGNQLGIAASSLRGMVSNLVEAASNSAGRLLDTKSNYSRRKTMQDTKNTLCPRHGCPIRSQVQAMALTVPAMGIDRYGMAGVEPKTGTSG